MPEKVSIWAANAPQPFGHYAQAIKYDDMLYISGQLPLDPQTGHPIKGDVAEQSRRVLENIAALVQSCGGQMGNLMTTTLYLTDLRDFPVFDKVSKDFFFFLPPARTTIVVAGLPGGCKVCMDAIGKIVPPMAEGKSMI
ncbi:MAG: Rid family detoxifying hydrolase [Candidatus Sumerlaeia bacterium]|nr:Rid family detoxifying hydrolase [Candidatus Sumerlaeia bacterium]